MPEDPWRKPHEVTEITLEQIIELGDFGDENLCLRSIAETINRKKLREIPPGVQMFELLTGTFNIVQVDYRFDSHRAIPDYMGHASLYCSAPGCHFGTEFAYVQMPGELGGTYLFPTPEYLDEHASFPCKLRTTQTQD